MNGVLVIDKPSGPSSHDIVARVRKLAGERRVGHTGTLDPLATGLLVLCLGRATRFARFLSATSKTYLAKIRFGYATNTYDRTGDTVGAVVDREPDPEVVARLVAGLAGVRLQVPPPWSAKKVDGKRAYALARAGSEFDLAPVEIEIHFARLHSLAGAEAQIELSVTSGTYIRSIAHELGVTTGLGAHLAELRRTVVGTFALDDAVTLEDLEERGFEGALLEPNEALRHLPKAEISGEAAVRLAHGRAARRDEVRFAEPLEATRPFVRVINEAGELVAICDAGETSLRPVMVWAMPERH